MLKAERLRKITNEVMDNERARLLAKNTSYAHKLINRKARSKAEDGRGSCVVKVSRRYSPSLVENAIAEMRFKVARNSKNGRAVLTIKW